MEPMHIKHLAQSLTHRICIQILDNVIYLKNWQDYHKENYKIKAQKGNKLPSSHSLLLILKKR